MEAPPPEPRPAPPRPAGGRQLAVGPAPRRLLAEVHTLRGGARPRTSGGRIRTVAPESEVSGRAAGPARVPEGGAGRPGPGSGVSAGLCGARRVPAPVPSGSQCRRRGGGEASTRPARPPAARFPALPAPRATSRGRSQAGTARTRPGPPRGRSPRRGGSAGRAVNTWANRATSGGGRCREPESRTLEGSAEQRSREEGTASAKNDTGGMGLASGQGPAWRRPRHRDRHRQRPDGGRPSPRARSGVGIRPGRAWRAFCVLSLRPCCPASWTPGCQEEEARTLVRGLLQPLGEKSAWLRLPGPHRGEVSWATGIWEQERTG